MKQCNLTKGFVVFLTITITFFFGLMPSAWANGEPKCDKDCFEGFFGFIEKGSLLVNVIPPVIPPPVPIASVGSMDIHWDKTPTNQYGSGTLTGTEITNFGGCCFESTISGPFTMTAPCTGIATVTVTPPDVLSGYSASCALLELQLPQQLPLPAAETTFSFVLTGEDDDEAEIRTLTTGMNAYPVFPHGFFMPLDITGIARPQDD